MPKMKLIPTCSFLILYLCAYSLAFQPKPLSKLINIDRTSAYAVLNPEYIRLHASASNEDMGTKTESTKPKLTIQEQILQDALNIEPETGSEKMQRQELLKMKEELNETKTKTRNITIAFLSFISAILNYLYQLSHPITDVQLLYTMTQASSPLTTIGNNGKPTVVDFWAPWCENCKRSASTLAAIEKEYGDSVNFVMINGDEARNWEYIERFHVDAIPHLALIGKDGSVETALIGPISRNVLRADLDFLLNEVETEDGMDEIATTNKESLPHTMFDAFQGQEEMRKVSF